MQNNAISRTYNLKVINTAHLIVVYYIAFTFIYPALFNLPFATLKHALPAPLNYFQVIILISGQYIFQVELCCAFEGVIFK